MPHLCCDLRFILAGQTAMRAKTRFVLDRVVETFGGVPIPEQISACGSDAASRFGNYFNNRTEITRQRGEYAQAIAAFCSWAHAHEYNLHSMRPGIVSTYLEVLHLEGTPIHSVRLQWQAVRLLFDWLFGNGLVACHCGAAIPDPEHGFVSDQLDGSEMFAVTVSTSVVQ
jgi:hypothetical protein